MTQIYGIDPNKPFGPEEVRDAISECFYKAHCEDSEIDQGDDKLTREYCEQVVKKAFRDAEADFETPTKDGILAAMKELEEFSKNFRSTSEIRKNYEKIMQLVEKL